ncbi:hypothetical protein WUBG_13292 [Wuchereria bancrofti]|nr:hypothetical protein WUBG_13292 [Wuchereria bancrofti]
MGIKRGIRRALGRMSNNRHLCYYEVDDNDKPAHGTDGLAITSQTPSLSDCDD